MIRGTDYPAEPEQPPRGTSSIIRRGTPRLLRPYTRSIHGPIKIIVTFVALNLPKARYMALT